MSGWATHEREALVGVLTELGPDAPTLCDGWQTKDLAAHVYVRERRPDAAAGVLPLGPLSAYTNRVMASALRTLGYDELVRRIRVVPPYLRVAGLDNAINTVEYFVHTEDVRRANGRGPRDLPPALESALWKRLSRQARLSFRRVDARVRLVPNDGEPVEFGSGDLVEVHGPASELTLLAFNRKDAARVDLTGSSTAVDKLRAARLGL
jgi:uncharacterized protein (TIGR03085 family)